MDPVSITASALTILQILKKVSGSPVGFIRDAGCVNQTLEELRSDLNTLSDLVYNIQCLFETASFLAAIRESHTDQKVNLVDPLGRALQNCARGVQHLADILEELDSSDVGGRIRQGVLQFRLNKRMDDIIRIRETFLDHKASIQLAFQMITT